MNLAGPKAGRVALPQTAVSKTETRTAAMAIDPLNTNLHKHLMKTPKMNPMAKVDTRRRRGWQTPAPFLRTSLRQRFRISLLRLSSPDNSTSEGDSGIQVSRNSCT